MYVIYKYFFASTYAKYVKLGERYIPGLYALCIIALLQCLNILSLLFLAFKIFSIDKNSFNKIYGFPLFMFILAINYIIIYRILGKKRVIEEMEMIDINKRKTLRTYSYLYIGSSLLFFIFVIILHNYI